MKKILIMSLLLAYVNSLHAVCTLAVIPSFTTANVASGESQTFNFTITGGTAPYNVVWSDGFTQTVTAAGTFSRTLTPTASTIYTITTTDANACISTIVLNITVAVTRIVMTAYDSSNPSTNISVFLPNGSLDPSFNHGVVLVDYHITTGGAKILIQPDEKLLLAGTTTTGISATPSFVFVRYNVDGTLDTTFGHGNGYIVLSSQTLFNQATALWTITE